MKNILTVDLEDWFVVENLKEEIAFQEWSELPARVTENTQRLLDLFDHHGVRATFFVLGWIAERHPHLIRTIASCGHEVACHSYYHNRIDRMGEEEFRKDTEMAIKAIADASGVRPVGYRAPSWSINSRIPWAFEILAEKEFLYDSSTYPIKHDIYGEPEGPKRIVKMDLENGRTLYEIPASTVSVFGKNFPVGGGGYLRHSPFWFTGKMIRKLNRTNRPAVIYIHPWELDDNQPKLKSLSLFQRYRQYGSIVTLKRKMELLLEKFDFCPAGYYIKGMIRKPIGFER
jgi:polysaccharide deacetylase family protein (PEP-CTERM system associated)